MNKISFFVISLLILQTSCDSGKKEEQKTEDTSAVQQKEPEKKNEVTLELKWTTDSTLKTCESVLYDKDRDILYVSNIAGLPPDKKDNNGFISKVSPEDGKIQNLKWVTGLSAPKGMGIINGKLYVTDITSLVEIDIEKGKIIKKYEVAGAKFLNDVAIAEDSTLYFSDSYTGNIHSFKNGKTALYRAGFPMANGLHAMNGKLYLASMDSTFKIIDIASKKDSVIATGIGGGDGVEYSGKEGEFIVSDWYGRVFYIAGGQVKKLLDTRDMGLNSADIEFIKDKNLLFVPTFMGNAVHVYEVKM